MLKEGQTSDRIIDLMNRLNQDGSLCRLVDAGLLSPKVVGYIEIWNQYDINIRLRKMRSMDARYAVSVTMNCDVRTVHNAIAIMQRDHIPDDVKELVH